MLHATFCSQHSRHPSVPTTCICSKEGGTSQVQAGKTLQAREVFLEMIEYEVFTCLVSLGDQIHLYLNTQVLCLVETISYNLESK
nr:hypothetical protein Iba_chr06aCG8220 [Ipomoea batatas]